MPQCVYCLVEGLGSVHRNVEIDWRSMLDSKPKSKWSCNWQDFLGSSQEHLASSFRAIFDDDKMHFALGKNQSLASLQQMVQPRISWDIWLTLLGGTRILLRGIRVGSTERIIVHPCSRTNNGLTTLDK
eukprot:scaffold27595_cov45-Attheya_sp.AAC.2